MPRRPSSNPPKYRKHKPTGQAVVRIQGQDFYLGPHDSEASKREYDRLIAEWYANGRNLVVANASAEITVVELIAMYVRFGQIFGEIKNKISSGYNLREIIDHIDELRFRSQTEKHELSHLYEAKIRNMGNAGRNCGE